MATKSKYYRKWLLYAPLGLVLVGAGLCFVTESFGLKQSGAATMDWVLAGTGSLIVFNAGLCFFGEAVVCRVRYLAEKNSL
ncbi:MAG: hypothetical protein R8G66_33680 [Cytophagales bacterium]|nr:hypothetical protein [Cytophagales bacterium]